MLQLAGVPANCVAAGVKQRVTSGGIDCIALSQAPRPNTLCQFPRSLHHVTLCRLLDKKLPLFRESFSLRKKHTYCYAVQSSQTAEESQGLSEIARLTRDIRKLGRDGHGDKALRMLKEATSQGLPVDLMAVTAVIGACIQGRQMALAEEAFSHFFESGLLTPDDVVFVAMIRGYGECKPPQWDKVGLVMAKMRRFGLRPGIMHYNQLLSLAVAANDAPRALQLIDRMVSEGVEPDDATMDAIRRKRVLKSYIRKQFPFLAD